MILDWSYTYWSMLPVRWQNATGGCVAASVCGAMEMRAILQGYILKPADQLAMLYNMWWDGMHDINGASMPIALPAAKTRGICLESLMPMPAYVGINTATLEYQTMIHQLVGIAPSEAAEANAPSQVITSWDYFMFDGTPADKKAKAIGSLTAGYPLLVINAEGNHMVCAWGHNDYGLIGPDSRGTKPEPYNWSWDYCRIAGLVRGVRFTNALMGPPPTVPLPKPPVIVLPQPPPPTGNTQMLIDTIKSEANALVKDQITQQQVDELRANVGLLVADAQAPAPTPAPVPLPPGIVHDIGGGGSFVSATGDTWAIVGTNTITRNGKSAAGLYGPRVVELTTLEIKALRNTGSWFLFGANGTWSQTSAPV